MRKILAGFMATSMIVAMASATTFAAVSNGTITVATSALTVTPNITFSDTLQSGSLDLAATISGLTLTFDTGEEYTLPVSATSAVEAIASVTGASYTTAMTAIAQADVNALLADLNGTNFSDLEYNGNVYSGSVKIVGNNIVLTVKGDKFAPTTVSARLNVSLSAKEGTTAFAPAGTKISKMTSTSTGGVTAAATVVPAGGNAYADVEKTGSPYDANLYVDDVLICDGSGNPIPFTESKNSVDEAQNSEDGIQSGATLYFLLRDDANAPIPKLNDDTYWKLKVTKGDNAKHIKAITDVSKTFNSGLYALNGTKTDSRTVGRHRYIKVELNDIYTDDEYKITLDMRISAKTKAVDADLKITKGGKSYDVTDDDEIKVKDFYFYMKNLVKDADNDWEVGIGGLMLNPIENDWNEVTYYDEDGDVAFMKFFADSDTSKFYAKLSTKWEHADYASYFNDQDAYIFSFTGSPSISATSRCDLEIYNPFINEDGDETIDPASATIYQVIDGDLFDVTDSFAYKEGTNGDMAFTTRTRFLGTYIICEKPVEEAVDNTADVPTDLVPEDTTPSEVTPDNNNGGKAPANTGKYL